jgi:hypothetical protein
MYYFQHFKNDDWRLKVCLALWDVLHLELPLVQSLVAVAFTVDTVSWLGDCAAVYLVSVSFAYQI